MQKQTTSRRNVLRLSGLCIASPFIPKMSINTATAKLSNPAAAFSYCLNMSTLRGHRLGFVKELETASQAGFRSVEIWMNSLQTFLNGGGTIAEARRRIADLGLTIENSIGFAEWIVDDEARRKRGLEVMTKEMNLLAEIGCKRTAAPPAGATEAAGLDLQKAAERYRVILDLGDKTGVVPHLELWGFSKNLSRACDVLYVALESGHPSAKLLLDIYHLYKGGSPIDTLSLINPAAVDIMHMNDYTAQTTPSTITDADRIYAGDGTAPIKQVLKTFARENKPLILSTEVFNKNYYAQDALLVAKTALEKMKKVVAEL